MNERYKKKAQYLILLLIVVCLTIGAVVFFCYNVVPVSEKQNRYAYGETENAAFYPLEGYRYSQTFVAPDNEITGFAIRGQLTTSDSTGKFTVSLLSKDRERVYFQKTFSCSEATANGIGVYYAFYLDTPITECEGQAFIIEFEGNESMSGVIEASGYDDYQDGQLYLNGELRTNDLRFLVLGGSSNFILGFYWVLFVIVIVTVAMVYYFLFIKKVGLCTVAFIAILGFGILNMLLTPPGSGLDESAHMATAYRQSNFMLGYGYSTDDGKMLRRVEDSMDGLTRLPTGLNNYGTIASELFKTESIHGMVVTNDREVKTFPLVYTPAAIGISLARILNLGRMPLFLLGRLCNLLLFATLAYFAIKHIPFGKMILVGISLLPMTISLVSSYNYDSYIFGISMLFVANCLRLVYKKNIATNKDYLSILIPAILLAPVKLIYVFLLGLCLLIPKDCFGGTPKNYYKKIFFLFGCGALMLLLSNKASIVSMFGTREVNSWVGAETYSLSYIFSDFFAFAKVIVQTIWTNTPQYLQLMFGGVYNCMMSFEIQITLVVLLGLSSIKIKGEGHEFTTRQKIWLSVLGSTIVGFAILAMFSGYTPTGSTVVLGVQGRYFLPALPLFLFIVRGDWLTLKKSIDNKLLFAFCSVNCVAALRIFQACIER